MGPYSFRSGTADRCFAMKYSASHFCTISELPYYIALNTYYLGINGEIKNSKDCTKHTGSRFGAGWKRFPPL